jgi:hypothetical protein
MLLRFGKTHSAPLEASCLIKGLFWRSDDMVRDLRHDFFGEICKCSTLRFVPLGVAIFFRQENLRLSIRDFRDHT